MSPRRILVVIESLGRGGAERLLVTTLAHIDRDRFRIEVASLFGPNPLADEIRSLGSPVHELGLSGPRELLSGVLRLRRLIRRGRFDVVHTHLFGANVAGRVAAGSATSVVTTLHNPDYGQEGPPHGVGVRRLIDGGTARLFPAHRYLAVSEDVRVDYRRQLGLEDVQVLHNYLDVDAFQARVSAADPAAAQARLGVPGGSFVFLHVGRFHRQKGHDVLLPAFAELHRAHGDAYLVLAGRGPERGAVEAQAAELGVDGFVRFAGSVDDVAPLYAAADAFVFPSRYEAFGVSLLEAMAAGLPSVVTRVGGITELTSPQCSLFVAPGDWAGLAAALRRIYADGSLRAGLAAGAVRRAKAFDVSVGVRLLERVYEAA